MQTADIILAINGDAGSQIPKFGVTPAEVAVLRAVHGEASVTDIAILDEEAQGDDGKRTHREELERLKFTYYRPTIPGTDRLVVNELFPGMSARLPDSFGDLEIPDIFYKAISRATPAPKPAEKPKRQSKKAEEKVVEDEPVTDEDPSDLME